MHYLVAGAAWTAAAGWSWSLALLATREHQILDYHVVASAPALWGFLALPAWKLLLILLVGAALGVACTRRHRVGDQLFGGPVPWLLVAYLIPLADAFRALGFSIAVTFIEPLLLTWISGAAIVKLASGWRDPPLLVQRLPPGMALAMLWLVTIAAGGWWYVQGCAALDGFLLGYHDFGHFAFRVASTWEGRGFLLETPSLPAFWDHFNPGLALLAPLWGLWPDARLFILLQAVCLASPAPLVFQIARSWGMTAASAAVWAAAYLAFPAVGQLNLNYSYGWHPISLALPWMFAALAALMARRVGWAASFAVLACSFEEGVIVSLACLAAALGLQAWWVARRAESPRGNDGGDAEPARRLGVGAWLAIWALLTIAFVLIARYAAFTEYQTDRFKNLGESGIAIALSPLLRPDAFWSEASRLGSLLFLVALLLPLTPAALVRGRGLLLAAVFPLGLLMGWAHPPAKSIAFQYVTTLLPILLLAALSGARRLTAELRSAPRLAPDATQPAVSGDLCLGAAALASGLVASTVFGALPWSSPTLAIMLAQTYQMDAAPTLENPRAPGTDSNRFLKDVVALVNSEHGSVLASGRIASHLLNVRRLESVEQALVRWKSLQAEAGAGRSAVEVFDWVVLDTRERFQQSEDKMEIILAEARRVGYRQERSQDGILVLTRPHSNNRSAEIREMN